MGVGGGSVDVTDAAAGGRQRMDRRRHPRGSGFMATDAAEDHVPAPLPLSARISDEQLARGSRGRVAHGVGAWRVLSRVLLVLDGTVVLRRRDEPVLDRRSRGFRTAGEDHSARPLARPRCGRRFDRVGRVFADAVTPAKRGWLSGRKLEWRLWHTAIISAAATPESGLWGGHLTCQEVFWDLVAVTEADPHRTPIVCAI